VCTLPIHRSRHTAKAGIQYAAASRFIIDVSGILDHPISRVMTGSGRSGSMRPLNVVPANAGTHTPRPFVEGCCWTTSAQHKFLWLWVLCVRRDDDVDITSRSRGAIRPSFAFLVPPSLQRAQGMPGAWCARSRACSVVNTRVSHHGHTGTSGIPRAMILTAYFALSPVIGLFCHRHQRIESANLTPASRRQDHTASRKDFFPAAKNRIKRIINNHAPDICRQRKRPTRIG
jgi:hypothetical protein